MLAFVMLLQAVMGLEAESFGGANVEVSNTRVTVEATMGRESGLMLMSNAAGPVIVDYEASAAVPINLRIERAGSTSYGALTPSGRFALYPASDGGKALAYGREFGKVALQITNVTDCAAATVICQPDGSVRDAWRIDGMDAPLLLAPYGGAEWSSRKKALSFSSRNGAETGMSFVVPDDSSGPAAWIISMKLAGPQQLSLRRTVGEQVDYLSVNGLTRTALPNVPGAEILVFGSEYGRATLSDFTATPCTDLLCRCSAYFSVQSKNTRLQQWQCIASRILTRR